MSTININKNQFFIWEEKNLIEPKKNFENKEMYGLNDITGSIKRNVIKNEWKDIGKVSRICPNCNRTCYYTNKYNLKYAILNKSKCNRCKGVRKKSKDVNFLILNNVKYYTKSCPQCKEIIKYISVAKRNWSLKKESVCKKCATKNSRTSDGNITFRNNKKYYIRLCPMCNQQILHISKYQRDFSVRKNKKCHYCTSTINISKKIKNMDFSFGYNPNACKWIDKYGKQNGYNFQHALNGGEYYIEALGYSVDGYDKYKNVVIEYDEKQHYLNGNLRKKDITRMNKIMQYLQCKFYRFNSITQKLDEYHLPTASKNLLLASS